MALKRKHLFIVITSVVLFTCFRCSKKPSCDKLVEYIKAEKELRARIGQVHGIEDSVKILSDEYGIDLRKSYVELVDHPQNLLINKELDLKKK